MTTPQDESDNSNVVASSPKSIVIVGAGAASIQLAHTLWKESSSSSSSQPPPPLHVTILEANDYIGGRVRSFSFEGHTVEMGANWISGRETAFENPIWKLAQDIGLQGQTSDRENPERMHVIDVGGGGTTIPAAASNVITDEYLKQVARFDAIYAKALEEVASSSSKSTNDKEDDDGNNHTTTTLSPANDASVRSLLEKHGWTPKDKLSNLERAVEHNLLEVWVVDKLEELSGVHDMKSGANDMDLGQDEMFVEDPRGFNTIFDKLVKDLKEDYGGTTKILLGKEVQSIHYEPGNVKVVAKDVQKDGGDEDAKEEEYHADMIVSTVSLGVLQRGKIQFVPPLPDWKMAALNEVGMFTFAKVYAKFRKRLWPEDKDYLLFVADGESRRGHYPLWMKYKSSKEENLFMCYLGGSQAERVESLNEEELKDEIEELFITAFGPEVKEDCRPVSVAVTDWSRNSRFYGSYSYFPLGAFGSVPEADYRSGLTGVQGNDISVLQAKDAFVKPPKAPTTLYFAGEAFDDKFNGWVQGGYLSGQRVARNILEDIRALQREG